MRMVTIVCMFCALAVTGCGRRSQEKIIEKAMKDQAEVKITDDGMSIQGKDGKFSINAGNGVKVPPSFPSDVLVYKGAEILMAMEIEDGHSLQLKTGDDVATVAQAYQAAMEAQQWTRKSKSEVAGQQVFSFSKANRNAIVSVSKQQDATYVALVIVKQNAD